MALAAAASAVIGDGQVPQRRNVVLFGVVMPTG
jgi:hypothetical protein